MARGGHRDRPRAPPVRWPDGVRVSWDDTFGWANTPASAVGWFVTGADSGRVYIRLAADRVRDTGVGRTVDAFLPSQPSACRRPLAGARPAGPLGFFPNSCTWSSRIALGHLVLVGDAAGALDPTRGSVRHCSSRRPRVERAPHDGGRLERATSEFAGQRQAYYEVLRGYDRWCALLDSEEGPGPTDAASATLSPARRTPSSAASPPSRHVARTGSCPMTRRAGSTSGRRRT